MGMSICVVNSPEIFSLDKPAILAEKNLGFKSPIRLTWEGNSKILEGSKNKM